MGSNMVLMYHKYLVGEFFFHNGLFPFLMKLDFGNKI